MLFLSDVFWRIPLYLCFGKIPLVFGVKLNIFRLKHLAFCPGILSTNWRRTPVARFNGQSPSPNDNVLLGTSESKTAEGGDGNISKTIRLITEDKKRT